ncbi:beta-casein [Dipodomys spectabilis]|uniref:beta-casein n=1 Tax=Dipodomys spectabilis TaxID=105255 RepID=UPI001C53C3E4|nr:beta-casein [Dipodomys spectabilis]
MKVFLLACLVALALAREKEELVVFSESSESNSNSQEFIGDINKKLEKVKQVEQQQREAELQDKIHSIVQSQFPAYPFTNPIPYTEPQNILPVAQPAMVPLPLPVSVHKLMEILKAKATANPLKSKQMFPSKSHTISPSLTDLRTQHLSQLQLQSLLQQEPQSLLQLQSLMQQEPLSLLQLQSLLQQEPQSLLQLQSLMQQESQSLLQLQSLMQQDPQSFVQTHVPPLQLQEQPFQPEVLSLLQQVATLPQTDMPALDELVNQYILFVLAHQFPGTQLPDSRQNRVIV